MTKRQYCPGDIVWVKNQLCWLSGEIRKNRWWVRLLTKKPAGVYYNFANDGERVAITLDGAKFAKVVECGVRGVKVA